MEATKSPFTCDVPEGESGDWRVERFYVTQLEIMLARSQFFINPLGPGRGLTIKPGWFTRLRYKKHAVVMSDTPDEYDDHREFIAQAKGNVLIAGLGLGCALQCVLAKKEVNHVLVIEKSLDVWKLVAGHYQNRFGTDRLSIVEGVDIFDFDPDGLAWDVAWFDIWNVISMDNLPGMRRLRSRYRKHADWIGCRCERLCRGMSEIEWEAEKYGSFPVVGPKQ